MHIVILALKHKNFSLGKWRTPYIYARSCPMLAYMMRKVLGEERRSYPMISEMSK